MPTIRKASMMAALVLGVCAPVAPSGAQGPRVAAGSVVRVRAQRVQSDRIRGTVINITRDSMTLMPEGGTPVTIDLAAITSVEMKTGKDRMQGLLIGGLAGAGLGALAGSFNDERGGFLTSSAKGDGALILGTLGLVCGGVIGVVTGRDQWEDVPLPLDIAFGGTRADSTVTLSIRF
jgi:hypothetical protein